MDAILHALADPLRRDILWKLREGPLPAGAIAHAFPVSRPAVSRHLRVLREAGVVRDEAVGRERVYRLEPAPLVQVAVLLAELLAAPDAERDAWERRFVKLETDPDPVTRSPTR